MPHPRQDRDSTSLAPTATQTGGAAASHAQMHAAAQQANSELRALAAALGIDFRTLLRCLVKAVNFRTMLQCLRSGDLLGCLMDSVSLEKVLECALQQIPGGDGDGFSGEPGQDAEAGAGEFTG